MKAAHRHRRIPVEGGSHRIADWVAGVGRWIRYFVAIEGDRHADLVGRGIDDDPSRRLLAVGHIHDLDAHRSEVGVAVAQLHQIRAQQWEAVVDGVDPVGHGPRGLTPMGDDLRHRSLRIAEMLRPAEDVVPGVSLAACLLFVDAEVANARQRTVEKGVEGVRQRGLANHP